MRSVAFIALCVGLMACSKPLISGAPVALTVPDDANPSAIWLVRPIQTEHNDSGTVVLYGLFACYRPEAPGVPRCYLARTAGTEADLVWPDNPKRYKIDLTP